MKQYIVDAFAEELFTGNPAAVLPCKTMPTPEIMLKIAIENNYSETAFVVKTDEGKYDLIPMWVFYGTQEIDGTWSYPYVVVYDALTGDKVL